MRLRTDHPRPAFRHFKAWLFVVCSWLLAVTPIATASKPIPVPDGASNQPKFTCTAAQQGGTTRLVPLIDEATGACTGFEVHDLTGRTISVHRDAVYGSGRFVGDARGRRVVFVADFPRAKLLKSGRLKPLDRPTKARRVPFDAIVLFFDGRKVGSYSLETLLHRPFLVNVQGAHVRWLDGDTRFLRDPVGKTLTLNTTSFRTVTLDTESGATISAKDNAGWTDCDILVYGNMSAFADGSCGARPFWVFKGDEPKDLRFDLEDGLAFSNGMQTACLIRKPKGERAGKPLRAIRLTGPLNGLRADKESHD